MSKVIAVQFNNFAHSEPSMVTIEGHLTSAVIRGYDLLSRIMGEKEAWYISSLTYHPSFERDSESRLTLMGRYKK